MCVVAFWPSREVVKKKLIHGYFGVEEDVSTHYAASPDTNCIPPHPTSGSASFDKALDAVGYPGSCRIHCTHILLGNVTQLQE